MSRQSRSHRPRVRWTGFDREAPLSGDQVLSICLEEIGNCSYLRRTQAVELGKAVLSRIGALKTPEAIPLEKLRPLMPWSKSSIDDSPQPQTNQDESLQDQPQPQLPLSGVTQGDAEFETYLVCLLDGRRIVFLEHYLLAAFDMSPEHYREKFSLPPDYPMLPKAIMDSGNNIKASAFLRTRVEDIVSEFSSAVEAFTYAEKSHAAQSSHRSGRKPDWLHMLEDRADVEKRATAAAADPATYRFHHISRRPVVPVEGSVREKDVVCLIDGVPRVMLSRYLLSKFDMSPEEYRIHFDLPADYPMTSNGYRSTKSGLALTQGLGKVGRS